MSGPGGRPNALTLNGSLTIIVLTPLTTFSATRQIGPGRNGPARVMISLEFFHRGDGSSLGPATARLSQARGFRLRGADPDRGTCDRAATRQRPAQSQDRRLRLRAGSTAAQDQSGRDRFAAGSARAAVAARSQRSQTAQTRDAGGVAHRQGADLRPARRERRERSRLRLAQSQTATAEILSGAGQAEEARSRLATTEGAAEK